MFEHNFFAGWGDMDFNAHMRNTAFLDRSGDVRMLFFASAGFSPEAFHEQRIGPVIMRDEIEYFREIQLLEAFRVTLQSAGMAEDGSRFVVRNEFFRADDQLAARVTSSGGWLDLGARKLLRPPEALHQAMSSLSKTEDFQLLPSSIT